VVGMPVGPFPPHLKAMAPSGLEGEPEPYRNAGESAIRGARVCVPLKVSEISMQVSIP